MTDDSESPLDGIDPESVEPDDVEIEAVHAALNDSSPMVRQRGVEVCGSLAAADPAAVEPFADELARLTADTNAAISLRAIAVLKTLADADPERLTGRLDPLVSVLDSDLVDVQLTGAAVLGTLVVERPDLVAPFVTDVIDAVRDTEPDPNVEQFSDVVKDPVTRQTLQQHEESERERRLAARRTLVNVVVATAEQRPESVRDAVEPLTTLLDDEDPHVAGGAVDALGELAAVAPESVEPFADSLRDCLDHEWSVVRARAVRALGRLGDEAAVPKLRTLADEDEDEDVRTLAAETADFLAGSA